MRRLPVVVAADAPVKSFFTCWGYDSEYELTVDIYRHRVVWMLELDRPWADPPRTVEQSHEELLREGPPHCCVWGADPAELEAVVASVRAANSPVATPA